MIKKNLKAQYTEMDAGTFTAAALTGMVLAPVSMVALAVFGVQTAKVVDKIKAKWNEIKGDPELKKALSELKSLMPEIEKLRGESGKLSNDSKDKIISMINKKMPEDDFARLKTKIKQYVK